MFRAAKIALLSSLPLVAATLPVHAEIYKWVDEKGVVNYGATPPPGRSAKQLPADAPGVTVVPGSPAPPPAAPKSATDERVERLEKAVEAEKASRADQERREDEKRKAAIAQCEANRGVDCEEDPYQTLNGGYAVPGRVIVRPHPAYPPHVHKPPPPPPPKPKPPGGRERLTSVPIGSANTPDEKQGRP